MLSRREFLILGTYALALARARPPIPSSAIIDDQGEKILEFSSQDWNLLGSAMDVIIPAADGMPSATAAGSVSYLTNLCWQYPTIQADLLRFFDSLNRVSVAKFHTEFGASSEDERIQVLKSLEKEDATVFSGFVAYAYEAYYTRPRVLGLITCQGQVEEGDGLEPLLAPVRAMKHLYREAR